MRLCCEPDQFQAKRRLGIIVRRHRTITPSRSGDEAMRARVIFPVLLGLACNGTQPLRAQQEPLAVVSDPPIDRKFPPALAAITVPSHGVDMDAMFYLAAGPEPHGTVLLLHGLPGYEHNGDLAQIDSARGVECAAVQLSRNVGHLRRVLPVSCDRRRG